MKNIISIMKNTTGEKNSNRLAKRSGLPDKPMFTIRNLLVWEKKVRSRYILWPGTGCFLSEKIRAGLLLCCSHCIFVLSPVQKRYWVIGPGEGGIWQNRCSTDFGGTLHTKNIAKTWGWYYPPKAHLNLFRLAETAYFPSKIADLRKLIPSLSLNIFQV